MSDLEFGAVSNPEYSRFIQLSRYSRWLSDKQRRETWDEVVGRVMDFWEDKFPEELKEWRKLLEESIYNLEVMPSMRTLMTAGKALDRDNVAGYNCSYRAIGSGTRTIVAKAEEYPDEEFHIPLKDVRCFDEILYILMCGTGVGFSVERQFVNNLPTVGNRYGRSIYIRNEKNYKGVDKDELSTYSAKTNTIYVSDSKYGWASALRILVVELYNGNFDIKWNLSKIRPEGESLKTFGGRASGPGPLNDLFNFAVHLFKKALGRKLTSEECHDFVCKIAEIVVVGGVRRSALISLSNLSDERMALAKSGAWWEENPQRALSNNSVCYTETPSIGRYMREWVNLYESRSGERGIFNRKASKNQASRNGRRDYNYDFGTNPCSEIILRDSQFCNLSEVVVRSKDSYEDLKRKVELATILGTLQATLTNFKYLSPQWENNTKDEALLGVSLTGIMDNQTMSNLWGGSLKYVLMDLKQVAIETNKEWANKLKINQSAAITCVKPSGTVSQLVDSASGIHPRYSPYYIRTVRADKKDPLTKMMIDMGFPYEDDVTKPESTAVFSFPIKSPKESIYRDDRSALEQLELWLIYQRYWCEHKPSITVYVKENEWMEVGAWVYNHFDEISGVSFLPHTDHVYKQAPYQEISEEEYNKALDSMPKDVAWDRLFLYETEDTTKGSQEYACSGGVCEIVDI